MSISLEKKRAQKYLMTTINSNLVAISLDNVAKAEAMIYSNSSYRMASDTTAAPNPQTKYKGSSAYHITQLKTQITQSKQFVQSANLTLLFTNIVEAINRENNTRISFSEQAGIVSFLLTISNNLIQRLYNRDICLVCDITNCTRNKNYSFATKFCHYMCFFLFANRKQDNYSIYDNVVASNLGEYANYYGIKKNNGAKYSINDFNKCQNYALYSDVIDRVISASKSKISRNGFDHLLWYFHK